MGTFGRVEIGPRCVPQRTGALVSYIEIHGERHSPEHCGTPSTLRDFPLRLRIGPLISRNAENSRENQLYSLEWEEQLLEIYSLTLQRIGYRWRNRRHIHDDDLGRR